MRAQSEHLLENGCPRITVLGGGIGIRNESGLLRTDARTPKVNIVVCLYRLRQRLKSVIHPMRELDCQVGNPRYGSEFLEEDSGNGMNAGGPS